MNYINNKKIIKQHRESDADMMLRMIEEDVREAGLAGIAGAIGALFGIALLLVAFFFLPVILGGF